MQSESEERIYVEHLTAEHRRLDQLIHQTLGRLPEGEHSQSADWAAELLAGVWAIREELARHFTEEEAGGCLEEAVAHCPALSAEVSAVEAEHAKLLGDLKELIHRAERLTRPTSRDAQVMHQEIRALANELHLHEAR